MTIQQKKKQIKDLMFRINARRLQSKYSKSTQETIAISMRIVFELQQLLIIKATPLTPMPNHTKGLAIVGSGYKDEIIIKK